MRHVPVAEFKDKASEYIAAAERGEEIVITRHGKPAVRLVAVEEDHASLKLDALDGLYAIGQEILRTAGPTTAEERRAWISEGRP